MLSASKSLDIRCKNKKDRQIYAQVLKVSNFSQKLPKNAIQTTKHLPQSTNFCSFGKKYRYL